MIFVFFIYGLAFFLLGIVIAIYPKKSSRFSLAENLWLIACFGLIHGANEWIDMFVLINPANKSVHDTIGLIILPISFYFLAQFGINNMIKIKKMNPALKFVPVLLLAGWMIITSVSGQKILIGDIAARYLLCVPGTILTSYAMFLNLPELRNVSVPKAIGNLKLTAGSFLFYAFVAGIIVPKSPFFPSSVLNDALFFDNVGIPIQLFRACCAVTITYAVGRLLNIFEWETIDLLMRDITDRNQIMKALQDSVATSRTLLDTPAAAAFLADREGICLDANETFSNRFGKKVSDIIGKSIWDLFPPEVSKRRIPYFNEVIRTKNQVRFEDERQGIWNDVVVAPVLDSGGKVTKAVVFGFDITERKRIEKELKDYVSRLKATLESTADGILVVDNHGRVSDFNEQFARLWSIPKTVLDFHDDKKMLNFVLDQLNSPEHFMAKVRELYADPEANSFDVLEFKDGRTVERYSQAKRIDGKPVGRVWSFRDITERRQAEKELWEKESRYRLLFEAANDGIFILDSTGFTDCNQRGAEMYGLPKEQIIGHSPYEFSPERQPDGRRSVDVADEKIRTAMSGVPQVFEWQPLRADGTTFNVEITLNRIEIGGSVCLQAIVRDITERKKAEQELKSAHAELAQIYNTSVDGMVVIDKDFNLLRVNETFLSLLGRDRNEIQDKKCHDIFSSASLCHTEKCPMARILRGEEYVELETEKTRKDGVNIPCLVTATPFSNSDGEIIGIVEDIRDITERKKMEENILKIRKLESIGSLAGGIAHDFNNLFQVILGYISIAKIGIPPENKIYEALIEAEKASNQARDLSYRLLTFAKGGRPLKKLAEIKPLLSEAVSYALSYTNISCEFNLAEDLYPVKIDSGQIRQVIQNLLFNAQEAMPEGGTINVCAKNLIVRGKEGLELTEGRYVEISIKDHGVGIPEEILPRIFDPYFTTKGMGNQKGAGLGLAICYSIIKKHGGTITVESKVGSGTTFHVYLLA